jgi:chromosome segregation ATPase
MSQTATKKDLNNLEKKMGSRIGNLDIKTDRLALSIVNIEHRLDQIEDHLEHKVATKNDIQFVLNHIDAAVGKIQDFSRKALIQDYRFNQLEPKVEDHEKRIAFLEKKKDSY